MGVLDGVKVLEVAEQGFVPSAAAILADWGADVVKVERPTGDPLRHYAKLGVVPDIEGFNILFEQFNRNKRSVAIDLRKEDGRAALDRLIGWADVFITNFLPSARENLRVRTEDVWAVNPRCIYAIGTGQGLVGPDAELGGFDAVSFWARGGLGHILTPEGGPLVLSRGAIGDAPSGAYLAGGVAAALVKLARTGEPSVVDVSLLGAAVWTLSVDMVATAATGVDARPHIPGRALSGTVLIGTFRTSDDRWLCLNMLDQERHWEPTCRALGLEHLLSEPRYATVESRAAHIKDLHATFVETIRSLPLDELKHRLGAADTIWSTMASPSEVIDDPQVEANGYMPRVPGHPTARLSSAPVQFDGAGLEIRTRAPGVGEHTDEVFRDLGVDPSEIARLRGSGALA
jgi:crotonobetainyl-CoA:carnitine CoA-transferase CaiB-like acyl-CoA transferase